MLSGWCSWCKKRRVVHSHIQGFVNRARLLAASDGLNLLHLAKCGSRDRLMLMELHLVFTNERDEAG